MSVPTEVPAELTTITTYYLPENGVATVARYTCTGQPDRIIINGGEGTDKDALTILSGVFGRKVVFGKERKKSAE